MALKLEDYSSYLDSIGALAGISSSVGISTDIAEVFRVAFNHALGVTWETTSWIDVCPYGEARFVGNGLTYPNDLSKSANWTATALTITGDQLKNPLDGRTTASKLLETAATSAHSVAQASVNIIVSTDYNFSAFVRPNGRNDVYLKFADGVGTYTAFFDVSAGTVGTVAGTGATGNIQSMGSGYYLCTLSFTSASTASATGTATIQISTDGTLSYAGDTSKGLYVWGVLLQQMTNTGVADSLIAYDQTGETRMEAIFDVWKDSPFNTSTPRPITYELTLNGIQIISSSSVAYATVSAAGVTLTSPLSNPVFIWYRKQIPDFFGDAYDATATYAVDDQIYFTDSDDNSNFWKCIVATSAGQSPSTTAASWEKLQIPASLFYPSVYYAYAEWLMQDGQTDKAELAKRRADEWLADQADREERQQRTRFPFKVATHASTFASY